MLTLDSLNINYAKNIDSGSHETPKQETSSGFANIAQPLHVPGLPVHALGGHKVRRTFALQNAWRVGATWNTEMLRSISSFWTNTGPTLWWSIPICDMPHPLGHVQLETIIRTSNLYSWCCLRRPWHWKGSVGLTQRIPCMSTKSSLRIQSDSCSIYAHTCWQVDCDKNIFSSFIASPSPDLHYLTPRPFHVFIPSARSFIMLYRLTSLGHCSASGPLVQPRSFVHQQVHDFRLALLCRQIHGRVAWRLLTPELTPFNIFTYLNYLDLISMCIADFDKWRFNVWQPFSHSSHWLTGIEEQSPLQMSKTRMNSEITCFNKNVLRWWWQRHVQNSSSWTSRKPWRRERDINHKSYI